MAAQVDVMPDSSESDPLLDLATAPRIGEALRSAGVTVTAQDVQLKYVSATAPPLGFPGANVIGLSDADIFPSEIDRDLTAAKQKAMAASETQSLEIHLTRDAAESWHRILIGPLLSDGRSEGVIATAVDITPQKVSEEHLRLALIELAHRSKNLLAVVLAIARQSTEESASLSDFSARFIGRIRALGLAHDVLTDELWRGATVFSLVRSQLSTFQTAPQQSAIEGHNAYLKPNAVQHVGLALHELIAQSILSGALAEPEGRVVVSSALVPGETEGVIDLLLKWREIGVTQAAPGAKSPFGRALLERIVPAALSGTATLEESDAGVLVYDLRIPNSQFY